MIKHNKKHPMQQEDIAEVWTACEGIFYFIFILY